MNRFSLLLYRSKATMLPAMQKINVPMTMWCKVIGLSGVNTDDMIKPIRNTGMPQPKQPY
jgi:hypothetical protein